ncbi:MAG: hypothetical protein HYW86_03955 [Candidatus Roizmanbacteria bacterium]|nr:MAG: hypothetical protein HYW86_03955 [Candidatus Roizmanbacteria bacterium]
MLTKSDLEQIKKIINMELEPLKEDIVLFKDEILYEIIDLRDDISVVVGYRDLIEDHEQRITNLEKTPLIKL